MSAVEQLTIVLEHDIDEQYQYQPGEIVRGNIVVKTVRPTAIRNITIRVVGEGNVSWKDEDDHSICQAEETYCDASKVILDTRNSSRETSSRGSTSSPLTTCVGTEEKRLWGSCTFGKISARLTLERRGGVPGEDLFMHAEIKNHSQRTVTAMQASLIMMSIYLARNDHHFQTVSACMLFL
nr:hypothetical protein BaRGS_027469 [Batillaria attramentaria]